LHQWQMLARPMLSERQQQEVRIYDLVVSCLDSPGKFKFSNQRESPDLTRSMLVLIVNCS
jgi:hypothetical protein